MQLDVVVWHGMDHGCVVWHSMFGVAGHSRMNGLNGLGCCFMACMCCVAWHVCGGGRCSWMLLCGMAWIMDVLCGWIV